VLPIGSHEAVTSVLPITTFNTSEEVHLVLLTERGKVKKTPLKAFESISNRGLVIISLEEGDALRWARLCSPQDEVLIATK
jgi:DNA gyrase subunit A